MCDVPSITYKHKHRRIKLCWLFGKKKWIDLPMVIEFTQCLIPRYMVERQCSTGPTMYSTATNRLSWALTYM